MGKGALLRAAGVRPSSLRKLGSMDKGLLPSLQSKPAGVRHIGRAGERQIGIAQRHAPTGTAEMERKGAGFARSLSRLIGEAALPFWATFKFLEET